jgi:thiol-disulfide isomerase/thioredoxin
MVGGSEVVMFVWLAACSPPHLVSSGGDAGGSWLAPDNSWDLSEPPSGLTAEGFDVGQTAPDLRLQDQHGDEVSLWQFYGNVVVLDVSTMWCAPCRELAAEVEATQTDYDAEGFVYVTVHQQDIDGAPPNKADLELWASSYGIETAPILADTDLLTAPAIRNGQFPAVLILDRKLSVRRRANPPTDAAIRAAVESLL